MRLIRLLRKIFIRKNYLNYVLSPPISEPEVFEIKSIQSATERMLLKSFRKYGLNPEPQYKIGNMRVDFAFTQEKVIIEVDGPHHNEINQKLKDRRRNYFLIDDGWRVWRYKAESCYKFPDYIARKIKERLDNKYHTFKYHQKENKDIGVHK